MKTDIPIMYWPGFKTGALTASWDDGTLADRKLVAIYKKYGLKGTWNLNSGLLGLTKDVTKFLSHVTKEEVAELYDGQEVACHSCFHARLFNLPNELVLADLYNDKVCLEKLVGYPITGIVNPMVPDHNLRMSQIFKQAGFLHCRYKTNKADVELYDTPDDYLLWKPTCHYNDNLLNRWSHFKENHYPGQIFYLWGHSYSLDKNNDWDIFEKFAKKAEKTESIWHATKNDIYEYLHAWRNLRSSANGRILKNTNHLSLYFAIDGKKIELKPGKLLKY